MRQGWFNWQTKQATKSIESTYQELALQVKKYCVQYILIAAEPICGTAGQLHLAKPPTPIDMTYLRFVYCCKVAACVNQPIACWILVHVLTCSPSKLFRDGLLGMKSLPLQAIPGGWQVQ